MKKIQLIVLSFFILMGSFCLTSQAAEPVRLGYLQNDIHQLACWVALEKGLFKKEGLNVQVAGIFKAGPELMTAFAAGELDVGYVGVAPATTAVANKAADVQLLAQVNAEGSSLVVAKDSKLTTPQELSGRTIAVPGHATVQDFLLGKALLQGGVEPNQVNIIVVKPPEMIGALRTRQIEAFIAWEPYPAKAVTLDVGRVLMASKDIWPGHPCCGLVADRRFITAHPDRAKGLVKAHIAATEFILANQEEAVKIAVKYTGLDEETIRLAMKNVKYAHMINRAAQKEYVEFLARLGYIKVADPEAFIKNFVNEDILSSSGRP